MGFRYWWKKKLQEKKKKKKKQARDCIYTWPGIVDGGLKIF
jgi:hypothetical protein